MCFRSVQLTMTRRRFGLDADACLRLGELLVTPCGHSLAKTAVLCNPMSQRNCRIASRPPTRKLTMQPLKAVAIMSGGLDSTTLAYFLREEGYQFDVLSFDYGQRH